MADVAVIPKSIAQLPDPSVDVSSKHRFTLRPSTKKTAVGLPWMGAHAVSKLRRRIMVYRSAPTALSEGTFML